MWTEEEILERDPNGTARGYMWARLLRDYCKNWETQYTSRLNAKKAWMLEHNYPQNDRTAVAMNNLLEKDFVIAKPTPIDIHDVWLDEWSNDELFDEEDMMDELAICGNCVVSVNQDGEPMFVTQSVFDFVNNQPINYGWNIIPTTPIPTTKDNNMGYEYNMEVDQRNHLKRRLDDTKALKGRELRTKYHLDERHPARTKDEVKAALAAGEFTMPDWLFDDTGRILNGYNPEIYLSNPKTDREGYASAEKLLGTAYTAAKDAIIVKPLADGLTALNEFEKTEF